MDDTIKKMLLQKGARKADYFAYDEPDRRRAKRMNLALWPKTIAKNNLLTPPNAEILAVFTEKNLYIARTMVIYDSVLQQYRDESRPYVSKHISTSPKVCRTLLNLAGARPGDTILDPFCGTGTIVYEAQAHGMMAVGVDNNPLACVIARGKTVFIEAQSVSIICYLQFPKLRLKTMFLECLLLLLSIFILIPLMK